MLSNGEMKMSSNDNATEPNWVFYEAPFYPGAAAGQACLSSTTTLDKAAQPNSKSIPFNKEELILAVAVAVSSYSMLW